MPTRSFFRQLYEPYSDNPETRGFMRLSTEVLNEIIPNFLRDGWQVVSPTTFVHILFVLTLFPFFLQNIHAIGDRANAIVLDVFENALKTTNVTALRPRLEHAQIMTRRDMARLGKLGGKSPGPSIFRSCIDQRGNSVIASVQPTHA